jgi:hypothetical protein
VKNRMTFANGIMGKGKGPLPALAARMIQVLTIGSFSYCIMEKFLDWQQDIEQSFETKAYSSPRRKLATDDDAETNLPYVPGKQNSVHRSPRLSTLHLVKNTLLLPTGKTNVLRSSEWAT